MFSTFVNESPKGKTFLFSVGQAGFIIKNKAGKLLGIDLYLSDYTERDEGHVGFKRLLPKILFPHDLNFDYLVATHPHSDHYDFDSMSGLMSNQKTKLFASVNCEVLSKKLGLDTNVEYVKPSDSVALDGYRLHFVNCDHGAGAPDAVGVIIEVDGCRILEVGDTCLRLDRVDEYLKLGPIDVLIAPINGAYGNLNELDCAVLANHIKPRLTIPCHFGMFASHGGSPALFMEIMKKANPLCPFLLMTQGERLELK